MCAFSNKKISLMFPNCLEIFTRMLSDGNLAPDFVRCKFCICFLERVTQTNANGFLWRQNNPDLNWSPIRISVTGDGGRDRGTGVSYGSSRLQSV